MSKSSEELYTYISDSGEKYNSNKEVYLCCNRECFTHFDEEKFSLFRTYLENRKLHIQIQTNNLIPHPKLYELKKKYDNNSIEDLYKNQIGVNPLIIDLTDEKGELVKVEIVKQYIDIETGRRYVVANDLSNDIDSYILEVSSSKDGDLLQSIDEDEFNRVVRLIEEEDTKAGYL